ncbi:MAG TPA: type II toxin-antitoxin system RelE/ParE family toxin [Gemmatimonadota bacterium]|nr:type II toxin-antitoxin system RelE/ParE family toxin [Gemmatimonadota bacterium]
MPDAPQRSVRFSRSAAKAYEKLPARIKEACLAIIRELSAGEISGSKLKGELAGLLSLRLGRAYRLLYRVGDEGIKIVDVGPRGDIYWK